MPLISVIPILETILVIFSILFDPKSAGILLGPLFKMMIRLCAEIFFSVSQDVVLVSNNTIRLSV